MHSVVVCVHIVFESAEAFGLYDERAFCGVCAGGPDFSFRYCLGNESVVYDFPVCGCFSAYGFVSCAWWAVDEGSGWWEWRKEPSFVPAV